MIIIMRDGRKIRIRGNSIEGRIIRGLLPPVLFGYNHGYVGERKEKAIRKLQELGIIRAKIEKDRWGYFAELLVENIREIKAPEGKYTW